MMSSETKEPSAVVGEKRTAEMEAVMEKYRAQVESIHNETQAKLESIHKKVRAELESIAKENALESTETIADDKSISISEPSDMEEGGETRISESGTAGSSANVQSATRDDGNGGPGQGDTNNSDRDENIKKELFVNSTHQLFFMDKIKLPDGRDYEVKCWGRFMALAIIGFQFYTFIILVLAVYDERDSNGLGSPTVGLEIESKYCHDPSTEFDPTNYYDNLTVGEVNMDNFLDLLSCSEFNYDESDALYDDVIIHCAFVLLSLFLLQDFFEAFVLFRCGGWRAKVTSVLVLLKGIVALCVGWYGLNENGAAFSLLDTFFFIVGIVFVHDLDDKFGHMRDVLRRVDYPADYWKPNKWCRCCGLEVQFWIFYSFVVVVLTVPFYEALYGSYHQISNAVAGGQR